MNYLKKFQLCYPSLVKSMKECSHHYSDSEVNPFHIEGDTWSHTCMTTKQLEGSYLELAGVLHDIGKTAVRYENHEKKRVRFSGHENMSAFMALNIFKDWNLSQEDREFFFKLIALHGEPYRLDLEEMNKRLTNQEYLAQSLSLFGLADHRGRFTDQIDDKHKTTQLIANVREPEKFDKEVVFLVGLPGSGKSTYIQENYKDWCVVSRDELVLVNGFSNDLTKGIGTGHNDTLDNYSYDRAWNVADQQKVDNELNKLLNQVAKFNNKVVIDMTNLNRKQRLNKLKLFKDFHKKAVVLLPDMLTLFDRLEKRQDKTIPEETIKKMIMNFSPPGYDEFSEIIWRFE